MQEVKTIFNETKIINRAVAIIWLVTVVLAFVFGTIQINQGDAENIALNATLPDHSLVAAVFGIGIVLLAQTIFIAIKNRSILEHNYFQIVTLGLFVLIMSVQMILAATVFQNTPSVYIFATQLLMLALTPYIAFVADLMEVGAFQKGILCDVISINFLVQNLIALFGENTVYDLLWVTNLINMLVLVICFYWIFRNRETQDQTLLAFATLIFAVFCGLEIIAGFNSQIMLMVGFAIMVAAIYILARRTVNDAMEDMIVEEVSYDHALTDFQTGFGSRLAFNQFYYNLKEEYKGNVSLGVLVIDINNIKDINDHYGYQVGDQLILGAADCIAEIFAEARCFRTGGDEFAIVSVNSPLDMEALMYQLDTKIMEYNLSNIHQLSIARGLCIDNADVDDEKKLRIIYKAADDRMYNDKIQKHEQLKVKMIQETYLKKQMLQEQMIKEKQFQEQMEKVAEAKLEEDKKQGYPIDETIAHSDNKETSDDEQATSDLEESVAAYLKSNSTASETASSNFHPLPRTNFWGEESTETENPEENEKTE